MDMMSAIGVGDCLLAGVTDLTTAGAAPIGGQDDGPENTRSPVGCSLHWILMRFLSSQIIPVLWLMIGPAQAFAQSTASRSESTAKNPAFAYMVASLSAIL